MNHFLAKAEERLRVVGKMKRIIFFGAPGAGKGTQSSRLQKEFGFVKIATGDLVRTEVEAGTELGIRFKEKIKKGQLVSDDIIIQMVKNRLAQGDIKNDYIVDGFPRTIVQADALTGISIDEEIALYLKVGNPEVVVHRALSRLTCIECGAIYTARNNPPEREIECSKCGGVAKPRTDDTEEVIRKRIQVYRDQTKPVIEYYRNRGILREIDASQSIDEVFEVIKGVVS